MDVIIGKEDEKNKHMIPLIFGAIILLTGAIFAINSNKKLLPVFNIDSTPATIPVATLTPPVNYIASPTPALTQPPVQTFSPVTELKIEDLKIGTGAEVATGSSVTVHYIGRLTSGQVFDSSVPKKQPLVFQVGGGQVIKGWDQGILGMKVGGQRRIIVPPDKGYGPNGYPPVIPPNATLIFDIELLDGK